LKHLDPVEDESNEEVVNAKFVLGSDGDFNFCIVDVRDIHSVCVQAHTHGFVNFLGSRWKENKLVGLCLVQTSSWLKC
jgi:hypothetical protein